jgi:hypothetical protein
MASPSSTSASSSSDKHVLELMDACESYAGLRVELAQKLSAGMFQLAQARKHGKMTLSADDVSREDFEARLVLGAVSSSGSSSSSSSGGLAVVENSGDGMDSLMMFTALPPPALRRAQALFADATRVAAALAQRVRDIDRILQS